ncbi:hypothetical protein EDC39_11657 [Geothermobacter ehrlichii]|uniref:7-cyano-7-deazaguanine synthase in queuosine biosynthesis n=1 Tax=Geothermobacter ehrlichii TaxID=213224 RepID=A0A5D3WGY9_9BACT|nr:hypothetical protein [Geothermobacter ehrlichii]TYO95850.1 hypothetical protein EDC39_11657 [Geothermobacter ehrlichii]
MRIDNLRKETADGLVRIAATVQWEDCDAPDREVWFATEPEYADALWLTADPFLLGTLLPALEKGERRLSIAADLCPRLLEGLQTALGILVSWYGDRYRAIPIEGTGLRLPRPDRLDHTAVFMSGGIDALAALRINHLHYPPGHRNRIRSGILMHGFDIGGVIRHGSKQHVHDRARRFLQPVVEETGIELIPAWTNVRHLHDDSAFFLGKYFGALLCSMAQALTGRIDRVVLASSYDLENLGPCGSHPMLDHLYGSADLEVFHAQPEMRRIDKLRLIADWETGLHNMRVCLQNVPDRLNCGWCEKCLRTMAGLVALGKLEQSRAFEESDLDAELFSRARMTINHREPFYIEMIEPLRAAGRNDLADVIVNRLAAEGKLP